MKQDLSRDVPAAQFASEVAGLIQTVGYGDLSEAMAECAGLVNANVRQNFDEAIAPHGGAWPERKDPKPQHPLLILSGDLKGAATEPGGRGHIQDIMPRSFEVGVDSAEIPYAWTHQAGDPDRNISRREYEDVDERTLDAMCEVVADAWLELLGGVP